MFVGRNNANDVTASRLTCLPQVELGGSAHRNIVLSNMSKKVMAFFRFEGGHGAFRFSPAFGEIRPGLTACVKVLDHAYRLECLSV